MGSASFGWENNTPMPSALHHCEMLGVIYNRGGYDTRWMRRLDHEAHYKASRVLLRNRLWEGPSPVAYFRLIDTFAVRRVDTLDNLGFNHSLR